MDLGAINTFKQPAYTTKSDNIMWVGPDWAVMLQLMEYNRYKMQAETRN